MQKTTVRALVYEHNILNGFWFVLIEFILVALIALGVSLLLISKGGVFWAIIYFGIAINAAVICALVIGQMRRGERSSTIAETFFGEGRETTRREHPNLDQHTFQLVVIILVPFLLAALILVDR